MKFTCATKDLRKALNIVKMAVPTKPDTPILSGLHIVAKGDKATLHGASFQSVAVCDIPATVKTEGEILINAKRLLDIAEEIDGDTVSFNENETYLSVRSGKSAFKLIMMKLEQFPALPDTATDWGNKVSVTAKKLHALYKETAFALKRNSKGMRKEDARPIFSGINCFVEKDKLTFAATNQARMAVKSVPCNVDFDLFAVFPDKPLDSIVRCAIAEGDDCEVTLSFNAKRRGCMVSVDGWSVMFVVLSQDKTADIRTIIPKGYDTAIESDTEDLSGAITRMSLCGGVEEGFSEVAVKVGMDEIVISAKDPNLGWGTESVSCKTEGEEVTLSLNAGYLTDMMNAVPYTRFRAEMSGPNRAVVFTPVGAEGYKYVLVPLQQRAGAVA